MLTPAHPWLLCFKAHSQRVQASWTKGMPLLLVRERFSPMYHSGLQGMLGKQSANVGNHISRWDADCNKESPWVTWYECTLWGVSAAPGHCNRLDPDSMYTLSAIAAWGQTRPRLFWAGYWGLPSGPNPARSDLLCCLTAAVAPHNVFHTL